MHGDSCCTTDTFQTALRPITATNLELPLTNWLVLTNGTFDSSGNFSSTNAVGTNAQQFYILQAP